MTGWLEILVVAFVAQLLVLPGEKVQFIVAALSTRYSPLLVVAAAGTAFAGWTALEIVLGGALKGALPTIYLDGLTALLFLAFAAALIRSAPDAGNDPTETDGGEVMVADPGSTLSVGGWELPDRLGGFLPIFVLMAVGEFGDKTQLVTIGLAAQYGARPAIWAGEMLAIVPVTLVNALFFHRFTHRFNARKAHYVGAVVFFFFGADTLLQIATGVSVWEAVVSRAAEFLIGVLGF